MNKFITIIILIINFTILSASLSETINNYQQGRIKKCKKEIINLNRKFKHNSNLLYLNGLLSENGSIAFSYFKEITVDFPNSSKFKYAKKQVEDYLLIKSVINNRTKTVNLNSTNKTINNNISQSQIEIMEKNYYLQLGSFQSRKNAEKLVSNTRKLKTFIMQFEHSSGKLLYRVLSGPFKKNSKNYSKNKNILFEEFNITPLSISAKNL